MSVKLSWITRGGQRRQVKLYRAWHNMNSRAKGTAHDGRGNARWKGLHVAFSSWEAFRTWALANGYSAATCSLDRIDNRLGYSPANCQWLTRSENSRKRWTDAAKA